MIDAKRRVFLSFVVEDEPHVNGLRLLAATPKYPLEFFDESVRVSIDSRDADYIKSRIRDKITRASVTVCLISELTHASPWVDWELRESERQRNSIIAMAVKGVDSAILPPFIKQRNLTFHAWDPEHLVRLIAAC